MKLSVGMAAALMMTISPLLHAGAGCVVAKKLGNSLAIEWVASADLSAAGAIEMAKQKLLSQGWRGKYQDAHPQANSELSHAHGVIVKTEYRTLIGKTRTSYGCGFSAHSAREAQQLAINDLRNYSWGWKPEFGYQVVEAFRF